MVGGVVNASARNVVQPTLRRFIWLSQRGVQVFVHDVRFRKNLFARSRRAPLYTMSLSRINTLPHDDALFQNIFAKQFVERSIVLEEFLRIYSVVVEEV